MAPGAWALVAVKARGECKTRLAHCLSAEARVELVRLMLGNVLEALRGAELIEGIAVVSPERDVLPPDVLVLPDPGGGLNAALDAARCALVDRGARELVVLPADLPLVTAADIDMLVGCGRRSGLALATDLAGTGTNALYLTSSARFRFQFGPDSRWHHVQESARLGLEPQLVRSRGLAFDLDRIEDLIRLRNEGVAPFAALALPDTGDTCLRKMRSG